ncbi:hypothetical protein [Sphingobacterium corticibacterium]|uniref:Uncharacterized protein n=1 Tax=Sphingobacterium corticibacterium TaxID=2484746 RepID=A0A4V2DCP3_9SPHI|nr:hypothetical protein [Sphingobacterium corticibacterium]RZF62188.1 hypothetical protein EWE74_05110 [Sphingobacterium corticibacterium]
MKRKKIFNYFRSPYFDAKMLLLLCVLGGTLATFFPFNDFSVSYIIRWKVFFLWLQNCLMSTLFIAIVSFTWYFLDEPDGDLANRLWSSLGYIVFGGILPLVLIIAEIVVLYGADLLLHHDMQYHIWFYAALIFLLNMYYRSVGLKEQLKDRISDLQKLLSDREKDKSLLQLKDVDLSKLKTSLLQKESELATLYKENMVLSQQATEWQKLYTIKTTSFFKVFHKSDIGGFLIDKELRGTGGKPIINMYMLSGESYIDNSDSLISLQHIFPEFKSVTRQLLVSPDSITGYSEDGGVVALHLKFLEEPYILPGYSWRSHKDWIKEIVDNEKAS